MSLRVKVNLLFVSNLLLVCGCYEELLWRMRWKRGLVSGAREGGSGMTSKTAVGMELGLYVWSAGETKVLCVGDGCLGRGASWRRLWWGDGRHMRGGSLSV